MLASAASWAFGLIASKAVLQRTAGDELTVVSTQLAASVAVLVVVAVVRRQRIRPALRHGWTGLLEPGLAYQLSIVGLAMTSASNATVLASLEPVVIPFVAWVVVSRRPVTREVAMAAAATAGAILVAADGGGGGGSLLGDALILASVVAAATYVVMSHRHVERHDPLTLASAQQTWALVMTLAVVAVVAIWRSPTWPSPGWDLLAVAGSGLVNYALPFVLYLAALRHLSLAVAAPYLASIPVFGVLGAATVLGERITVMQVVGAAVVVLALAAVTRTASVRSGGRACARSTAGGHSVARRA
jgi:drug/metabolite transporter (DMT)-like permease